MLSRGKNRVHGVKLRSFTIMFPKSLAFFLSLKGLCQFILASFLNPKCVLPQLNSKNNGLGVLFKNILWCLSCFLSFVETDGKDGNGLKLENTGPTFSSFDTISTKNSKKLIMGSSL